MGFTASINLVKALKYVCLVVNNSVDELVLMK